MKKVVAIASRIVIKSSVVWRGFSEDVGVTETPACCGVVSAGSNAPWMSSVGV